MPAWEPRVQLIISQPFLTSSGSNGYRLHRDPFVILRLSSSSVLKDLFQIGWFREGMGILVKVFCLLDVF